MEAALEEAAAVRKDFGYPIMVTPLSQFVGTQAAINVIVGERYKEVPDQNIQYALGIWGKEAVEVMDPQREGQNSQPAARQRMDALGAARAVLARHSPEIRRAAFRRRFNLALLRRRRLCQSPARSRQAARIHRRDPAAGKNHRATFEAQRFEPGLYQTTRLLRQDGETIRRRNPRLIVAVSSLEFVRKIDCVCRSSGISESLRLLKKAQMQGARRSTSGGVRT